MSVFKIRHLKCAYDPKTTVLQLDELDIPAGRMVFVIGKSGVGKSTLLETLGLMNRTILAREGTSILLTPPKGEACEIKNAWNWSNARLSQFRRQHLSFIFQQTNLMPNFTAGENMIIGLLLKGKSYAEAKQEVLKVMERLFLPEEVFDKKVTEISGGQRQRLAFVRAITADFTVLFGDEPTGNLDKQAAQEVMAVLQEAVRQEGKTVILVSHDLHLALHFADMIVPITASQYKNGQPIGIVAPDNIIERQSSDWIDRRGQLLNAPFDFLNRCMAKA